MMLNRLEYLRDAHMFGYRVPLDYIIDSIFDTRVPLNSPERDTATSEAT